MGDILGMVGDIRRDDDRDMLQKGKMSMIDASDEYATTKGNASKNRVQD